MSFQLELAGTKMTLYRVGAHSPIIDLLISAAEAGKQVAVVLELKARFDEHNNIEWATRLERAGVHVVYGVENLKTHCKVCLVVRKEAAGIRRYVHLGTGNYNRATACTYTDFALFTADPGVLDEVTEVFNALTGYTHRIDYTNLLMAPVSLRARLPAGSSGRSPGQERADGRIIVKYNAIVDPEMVQLFYRASQAGVRLDLFVRGAADCAPAFPASARTSTCGRSSAVSWSTPAPTSSRTAATRSCTSAAPT